VQVLVSETNFTPTEIKRIYKRFIALDTFKRGFVTATDLLTIPEVDKNPLGERICKVFETRGGDEALTMVDFKEFVKAMSVFHRPQAGSARAEEPDPNTELEKLKFLFKVYDLDSDGLLSAEEVRTVVRKIVGSNFDETHLHQIVDMTLSDLEPTLVDEQTGTVKVDFQQFVRIFQIPPTSTSIGAPVDLSTSSYYP
jgi:Ca2+-binding EF-hand superfamily protein